MATDLNPGVRYDMPVCFGPSVCEEQGRGRAQRRLSFEVRASHDAVNELVPSWFEVPADPWLSLNIQEQIGMEWMGGRSYCLVSIYVEVYSQVLDTWAPYCIVIWETDAAPIIAGREFLGTPKLYGTISKSDLSVVGPHRFELCEYGSPLLKGMAGGFSEVLPTEEKALSEPAPRLTWKYIPGLDGPDVSYPVAMYYQATESGRWKGKGEFEICLPDHQEAPFSGRIVEALSDVVVSSGDLDVTLVHAEDYLLRRDLTRRVDR